MTCSLHGDCRSKGVYEVLVAAGAVIFREVGRCRHTLSMPTMRGTRDMLASLVRQTPRWEHSSHGEVDMDDQYWSIQRTQVKQAFEWCLSRLMIARHGHGIFEFALSRLHKNLDRLGHAADDSFDIVDENDLRSFPHWDLDYNTRLVLGPLILEQSEIGVAIGGFLSSWEAEMWSMWKESRSLRQDRKGTETGWHARYTHLVEQEAQARKHIPPTPAPSPAPLSPPLPRMPAVSLSLVAPAPYVRQARAPQAVDLVQMRRRRQAASLTPDTVAAEGMAPWWHPLETIWGFFDVDDLVIPMLSPLPFDGDWEGRNGALIHATPDMNYRSCAHSCALSPCSAPSEAKHCRAGVHGVTRTSWGTRRQHTVPPPPPRNNPTPLVCC